MRTTLDLDADVLAHAKQMAAARKTTLGKVVSDLLRQTFPAHGRTEVKNGIRLLPTRGIPMTVEMVRDLRDEIE